jgi:hypothetical protein
VTPSAPTGTAESEVRFGKVWRRCTRLVLALASKPGSISIEKRWDFGREHAFLRVTVDKQLRAVYFALEQQVTLEVRRWSLELLRVFPSPRT